MFNWKSWAFALAIATGAFWLVMGHNPPVSNAAPQLAAFSPSDPVTGKMPTDEGGNAF